MLKDWARLEKKKYDLFLRSFLYDRIKNNIRTVRCYFIVDFF